VAGAAAGAYDLDSAGSQIWKGRWYGPLGLISTQRVVVADFFLRMASMLSSGDGAAAGSIASEAESVEFFERSSIFDWAKATKAQSTNTWRTPDTCIAKGLIVTVKLANIRRYL
jgi:hypothetical protein